MSDEQTEAMVKCSVRVPKDLQQWSVDTYPTFSDAVREGLTLLRDSQVVQVDKPEAQTPLSLQYVNSILDLQAVISGTLKSQLEVKDEQIRELHGQLDRQASLIKKLVDEPKALPAPPKSRSLWDMLIGRQ